MLFKNRFLENQYRYVNDTPGPLCSSTVVNGDLNFGESEEMSFDASSIFVCALNLEHSFSNYCYNISNLTTEFSDHECSFRIRSFPRIPPIHFTNTVFSPKTRVSPGRGEPEFTTEILKSFDRDGKPRRRRRRNSRKGSSGKTV